MKSVFNFIAVTLELGIVGLILLYFGVRIWLYSRFDSVVQDLNYSEYVDELKSTSRLPDKVFEAYEKIHYYDERTTTNQFLTGIPIELLKHRRNQTSRCSCVDVNYRFVYNTFDRWTVGLHLDNDVGSRKCLEYYLNNQDFLYNQIGIRNAAEFYFEKPLEALSEREMLELCLMARNPYMYNPITKPERIASGLKRYLER